MGCLLCTYSQYVGKLGYQTKEEQCLGQKTTLSLISVSEKQVMISTNTTNLPSLKKSKTYAQTKKHSEDVWMLKLETGTLKNLIASLNYLQDTPEFECKKKFVFHLSVCSSYAYVFLHAVEVTKICRQIHSRTRA